MRQDKQKLFWGYTVACMLCLLLSLGRGAPGWAAERSVSSPGAVHVLPIRGTIEHGVSAFICRGVREAERQGTAVLVEVSTFGGRVDAATDSRDCLLAAKVPVYTFVTDRAWSAGALIAMAGEKIAMAPASSLGAAEPRPKDEKSVSALRSEFAATAEHYGRDPQVAAAMVDSRIAIPDLVAQGELLTLRASEAYRLGFADVIAASREQVLEQMLPGVVEVHVAAMNWGERAAGVLTDPNMSSLLLTVGFLGLLVELLTPGWGIPGLVSLISLSLFFGGRLVVGIVGWEVVILFLAGLLLLLVEAVAVPGFGVPGILGMVAMFASLFLAYPDPYLAMRSLSVTAVATVVLGALLVRSIVRQGGRFSRVVLGTRQEMGEGYVATGDLSRLMGCTGVATTVLRPAGIVEIAGERVDALSEGGLIEVGRPVRVLRVDGTRVLVRPL